MGLSIIYILHVFHFLATKARHDKIFKIDYQDFLSQFTKGKNGNFQFRTITKVVISLQPLNLYF